MGFLALASTTRDTTSRNRELLDPSASSLDFSVGITTYSDPKDNALLGVGADRKRYTHGGYGRKDARVDDIK